MKSDIYLFKMHDNVKLINIKNLFRVNIWNSIYLEKLYYFKDIIIKNILYIIIKNIIYL